MSADPLSIILLVILVVLLAGLFLRSRAPRGDVIAFVGLSESGKTYMVSKLATADKADPDTQLSIASNQVEYEVRGRTIFNNKM